MLNEVIKILSPYTQTTEKIVYVPFRQWMLAEKALWVLQDEKGEKEYDKVLNRFIRAMGKKYWMMAEEEAPLEIPVKRASIETFLQSISATHSPRRGWVARMFSRWL